MESEMVDELKELVAVVNSLPQLALWVAVGFWAYKVIIIGSVYGVIKLAINKAYSAMTRPGSQRIEVVVDEIVYYTSKTALVDQLRRIIPDKYDDARHAINWLEEAISDKIEKDGLPKKKKPL